MKIRNTFAIFIVSGFWHGANWTFMVWGALNALYFLPLLLLKKNRTHTDTIAQGRFLPSFREFSKMLITFSLTVFAWIFFRAESLEHAFLIIGEIFSKTIFSIPSFSGMLRALTILLLIALFLLIEWVGRNDQYAIAKIGLKWKAVFRHAFYYLIIILILLFMGQQQQFIYFQF